MADKIENLIKISAPALSTGYGENIKKTFENIDSNFGALNNKDLFKGDPGSGLVSTCISFDVLLREDDEGNPIDYNMGSYSIESQLPKITEALLRVGTQEDVDAILKQLRELGSVGMILCYDTPTEDQTIVYIKSAMPFTYYDERFRIMNGSVEDFSQYTDMSGTLTFRSNSDDPENYGYWELVQNLPTLYYNPNVGGLCWKIGGEETNVYAQGPNGLDGINGDMYIVMARGLGGGNFVHPTSNNPVQCEIYKIWSKDAATIGSSADCFINISDYNTNVNKIRSGSPCIILPYPTNNDEYNVFYISTIIYNDGEASAYANITVRNAIYNKMSNITVKQSFGSITTSNTESDVIHGYFIKTSGLTSGLNEGYVFYVDQIGRAHISLVSNYDSPLDSTVRDNWNKLVLDGGLIQGYQTDTDGLCAHAEGNNTTASGDYSHTEGVSTKAIGTYSHAEGVSTKAIGMFSHAEGGIATASGDYSHAEGNHTTASGDYSHAEGNNTTASGDYSHAEGVSTKAIGTYSHAEGANTTASGDYSHAEGSHTIAMNDGMFVCGKWNPEGGYLKRGSITSGVTRWYVQSTGGTGTYKILFGIGDGGGYVTTSGGQAFIKHYAFIVAQNDDPDAAIDNLQTKSEIFIPWYYTGDNPGTDNFTIYVKLSDLTGRIFNN